jgi:hypothetical protein
MADKLTIKVRCDDDVVRSIVANLGTFDPVTRNYTMQMSEKFIEDVVAMFQNRNYRGVVNVILEKE